MPVLICQVFVHETICCHVSFPSISRIGSFYGFLAPYTVTPDDRQKAGEDPLVYGYIEKPLTQAKLRQIFSMRKVVE
jgi:hypothetical protein